MREAAWFRMRGARLVALVAVIVVFANSKVVSQEVPDMTTEKELTDLNIKIAEMERREQRESKEAADFFGEVLSKELVFRRVGGGVQGKTEFLDGLKKPYQFKELKTEEIRVRQVEGLSSRALVTLIIVGTRDDETVGRYRNIRLFSKMEGSKYKWQMEFWYNYELTSL